METKTFITTKEAAEYLGIKMSYLYKLTSQKKIPYYSPGGKNMLFKTVELDNWIEKSRVSSQDEVKTKVQSMRA